MGGLPKWIVVVCGEVVAVARVAGAVGVAGVAGVAAALA